jgi:uncharacterized protein (TIGR02246 family)
MANETLVETHSTPNPDGTPAALVAKQIDAYNAHDAVAFVSVYAENMQLFDLGGELFLFGRDALRERYAMLFANAPNIHVEIRTRIVVGDVVIDEEWITHTASGKDAHVGVIYEIVGGAIQRVWVTRSRS